MQLKGKHIVLGITGSIAAYKAASLARLLIKQGAEVIVVMTPAAKEFITPLTMATLTRHAVVSEFFDKKDGSWNSHVELGIWADLMIIAPASAATIAKMANGIADNMLITTYLSMRAPVWLAPAMDLDMFCHEATTQNIATLKQRGHHVIEPSTGFLASGLEGKGRMQEPEEIAKEVIAFFAQEHSNHYPLDLKGASVVITAGPTHEALDDVRYISNHSSGLMGIALAQQAHAMGAHVKLVLGPSHLTVPQNIEVTHVKTALQMYEAAKPLAEAADIVIFAAAVADYRPKNIFDGKIKREKAETQTIELIKNPDIAATLSASKKEKQCFVGFALESSMNYDEALSKLQRKGLDLIVLNSYKKPGTGFQTATNEVAILNKEGNINHYPLKSKQEVASDILFEIIDWRKKNSML